MALRRNTRPRSTCWSCGRDVAVDTRNADPDSDLVGTLVRHNDAERGGSRCRGTGDPVEDHTGPIDKTPQPEHAGDLSKVLMTPEPDWVYWWRHQTEIEIEMLRPKIITYGGSGASALDLVWIGQQMAATMGRQVDDTEATEIGIVWYLLGKIARMMAAIRSGQRVSEDSALDSAVYSRMFLRTRQSGGWPGPAPLPIRARKATVHLHTTPEEIAEAKAQAAANGWDTETLERALAGLKEM